jgi:hypothetical protein
LSGKGALQSEKYIPDALSAILRTFSVLMFIYFRKLIKVATLIPGKA